LSKALVNSADQHLVTLSLVGDVAEEHVEIVNTFVLVALSFTAFCLCSLIDHVWIVSITLLWYYVHDITSIAVLLDIYLKICEVFDRFRDHQPFSALWTKIHHSSMNLSKKYQSNFNWRIGLPKFQNKRDFELVLVEFVLI
jgi:hypothetical protein